MNQPSKPNTQEKNITDLNLPASSRSPGPFKVSKPDATEVIQTSIVVPPDGGWGWLVVLTSFICNLTTDGTMYTFGIFVEEVSTSLGCSFNEIALANSLMTGSYYISGPFISALTNKYGYRLVAILGGLISCGCILVASCMNTLVPMLVIYGIGGGIGFGMLYIPSIIVIGFYFQKWRALATSIAVTGSSVGIMLLPLIFPYYLKDKDWRYKFKILAASCFVSACTCLLYRPLNPVTVIAYVDKKQQGLKDVSSYISGDFKEGGVFNKYHNTGYPTTAHLHKRYSIAITDPTHQSSTSIYLGKTMPSATTIKSLKLIKPSARSEQLPPISENDEGYNKCCCISCNLSSCCGYKTNRTTLSRPLYRDDIFYSASLVQIPQYVRSSEPSLQYQFSVTRITTQDEIKEAEMFCICCPKSMKRTLATMLDFSLLKSPSFLILSLSNFFTLLGLYIPFLFIADRSIVHGMNPTLAYNLLTVIGISNGIGRIASGVLSSIPNINALLVTWVSLLVCGCATLGSSISYSAEWQIGFASIFGSGIACIPALRSIILVDMLGLDKLTNAFGLNLVFQGIASLSGVPLAGILKSYTNSYDMPFYFTGGVILFSGILLIPLGYVMKWEKKHNTT